MKSELEIGQGDGNGAVSGAWSLSNVVAVIDAPITPPALPSFNTSIVNISVLLILFILSLIKYCFICLLRRTKRGIDYVVIKLQDLIGNSEALDKLFGFEEVQKVINEAPKKQLEIKIKMNAVSDEQRDIKHKCNDLEKRLKRLAEKQAKYEAFLAKQAALKTAQVTGKDVNKVE